MAKTEFNAFKSDFFIPTRAEFNATNLHFERRPSFTLACHQRPSAKSLRDSRTRRTSTQSGWRST
eukprot:8258416-Alexandrium_andersonii.AAC.1